MVPFERALVSSYRPSVITFPLSLRVSEISPLLCSDTPHLWSPPNFPMFPSEQVDGLWATRCQANFPCNLFPRFLTQVILNNSDPTTSQTDGHRQTDDVQLQEHSVVQAYMHQAVKSHYDCVITHRTVKQLVTILNDELQLTLILSVAYRMQLISSF